MEVDDFGSHLSVQKSQLRFDHGRNKCAVLKSKEPLVCISFCTSHLTPQVVNILFADNLYLVQVLKCIIGVAVDAR